MQPQAHVREPVHGVGQRHHGLHRRAFAGHRKKVFKMPLCLFDERRRLIQHRPGFIKGRHPHQLGGAVHGHLRLQQVDIGTLQGARPLHMGLIQRLERLPALVAGVNAQPADQQNNHTERQQHQAPTRLHRHVVKPIHWLSPSS